MVSFNHIYLTVILDLQNAGSYKFYVFDLRYQLKVAVAQLIKVGDIFDGVVPDKINEFALVLTNKLVRVSSNGQKHFDLI